MRRTVLLTASMMVCGLSSGQALTLADAKAKNAVQLSASDLRNVFKSGDRYYAFDTLDDTARGSELEISK